MRIHRRTVVTGRLASAALPLIGAVVVAACSSSAAPQPAPEPGRPRNRASQPTQICTDIGCEDGLKVALEPGFGWPEGRYGFAIKADAVSVTCRGSLPLTPCADPKGTQLTSDVTCDRTGVVQIVESGCALSADAQAFPLISFDAGLRPQRVEISVTRNEVLVGHVEFAPNFVRLQPNGPGCPPTCHTAHHTLALDF